MPRTGPREEVRAQDPFEREHTPGQVHDAVRKALLALQSPLQPDEVNAILRKDGAALVIAITSLVMNARAKEVVVRNIVCSRNAVCFRDSVRQNFFILIRIDEAPQTNSRILNLRRFKRDDIPQVEEFGKMSYPDAPQRVGEGEFCFIVQLDAAGSVQAMNVSFPEYSERDGIRLIHDRPSNPFYNREIEEALKAMRETVRLVGDSLARLSRAPRGR